MTAPKIDPNVTPAGLSALERARRGLPLVERVEPSDKKSVDLDAWASQVVAAVLDLENFEHASPVTEAQP